MDDKRRSGFRNSRKPYKKGGRFQRRAPQGPISDSTAAEALAEYIISVLARGEESLTFTRENLEPGRVTVHVSCDPVMTGRIIGKGGKTIGAVRLVVRNIAGRLNKRVDINVASADDASASEHDHRQDSY